MFGSLPERMVGVVPNSCLENSLKMSNIEPMSGIDSPTAEVYCKAKYTGSKIAIASPPPMSEPTAKRKKARPPAAALRCRRRAKAI